MNTAGNPGQRKQRGFVLIAAMIMLIVLALMAVELYHNFTIQQNMTSNTKEKGRAFQMAQSTLQYAEYQLLNNGLNVQAVGNCTAPPQNPSQLVICNSQSPVNIAPPSQGQPMLMTNGMTFSPTSSNSNINVQFSTTGAQDSYFQPPQYFIQYLGNGLTSTCPSSPSQLYLNTALAYGGTGGTVAVVQSTYQLQTTVCNTGAP